MIHPLSPPMSVFDRLTALLDEARVPYAVTRHAPVRTSEEAAQIRGTPLPSGAKALVCKAGERFVLFVMPADRRLDSAAVRRTLGIRSLRFASAEEVAQLTGLPPGAIPPFGGLFGLPTYCDRELAGEPTINFNAGDRAISVAMTFADYAALERPTLGTFARVAAPE
jgi:prolyl-tRNA editing enzyme YbaK/EbsC (Cys-tRNA(Pro) deacylase)